MAEFKEEIAEKHAKSVMNKTYVFQRSEIYISNANTANSFLVATERMGSGEALNCSKNNF